MSQIDKPEAGFYRTRIVRGGPWCAVQIWYGPSHDPETGEQLDRSPHWQATINGTECDAYEMWAHVAGRPITEQEYQFLLASSQHAKAWDQTAPEAHPGSPIDFNRTKPVF